MSRHSRISSWEANGERTKERTKEREREREREREFTFHSRQSRVYGKMIYPKFVDTDIVSSLLSVEFLSVELAPF